MTSEEIRSLLEKEVKGSSLDVNLMLAIIETESTNNPWAVKYETRSTLYNNPVIYCRKNGIDLPTEKNLQHISWGLFQIMGFAARDMGFQDILTKLLIPEVNVIWGVEFFKARCMRRYEKIEDQIAAYNAGTARTDGNGLYLPASTQTYVKTVLESYNKFNLVKPS